MIASHIILATGWILFCVFHSVLASLRFKKIAETRMRYQYKFYRLYYTLFALASFTLVLIYQFTITSYSLFTPTRLSLKLGIIVAGFGLTIMCLCIVKYFMQLSGLKGLIENRKGNALMITGVHRIVRHPLYAGTFIFIWGLLIVYPYLSLFITDAIITIYTLIGLKFEEKKMEREFGDAYKSYQQSVPMIIPRPPLYFPQWGKPARKPGEEAIDKIENF